MYPLLPASKLRIPPLAQNVVHRPRLLDALDRRVGQHKCILCAAPAGYGKTTLFAQWARHWPFPVAWLSLGVEDNDLERFLRALLSSWEMVQPGVMESSLGVLLGSMAPDHQTVLSAFVDVADSVSGDYVDVATSDRSDSPHMVFVLDDYHLIQEPPVHEAVTFLLDHLPPKVHMVLVGRAEPPLPLARYRARQELLEFHTADLKFAQEETVDFFNQKLKLGLSHEEIARLQVQLEGWIAGLQMAALGLRRGLTERDKLLISGQHRFIADYLNEDVLAYLPGDIQEFLLQTSILDGLCAPLCNAVTERSDAQEMLERLERENLFIMPLDDRREWFRYHSLFADFLRAELGRRQPGAATQFHQRAARWYLAQELAESAFDHAIQGNDMEAAVQIIDRFFHVKLNSGEFRSVRKWIDALPAEWYRTYPALGLVEVGFLAFAGDIQACVRCLNEVEERLMSMEGEERQEQAARAIAVRCMMACMQNDLDRAEAYAIQALRELPEADGSWRPGVYVALGDTYRRNGQWEEAKACYLQALAAVNSPTIRFMTAHIYGALADLDLQQGRLHSADEKWRKALAGIQDPENWGRLPLPLIGWVYIRMGEILYERNELYAAWDHVARGLARAELGGDVRTMIAGYLIAGRVKLAEGDVEVGSEYLEKARPLVEQASFAEWRNRFERFQLELWLAQDRLRAAVDWVDAMLQDRAWESQPENEEAHLAMARVLIVKGDAPSVAQALARLERLREAAEAKERTGVVIEALALQSLAHWRCGEPANAMTSLAYVLRLAEPEGYVRLFADLGLPMARLLQEARSRAVRPDYVAKLLAAFGDDPALLPESRLPEPLSRREQEILGLLAAGLTNREIADRLVISPETVKKHTGAIYGKMGVHSRTEAAAKARALDLLG